MPSNNAKTIPLITYSSASVTASFVPMNAAPGIPHACGMIYVSNDSDEAITISFDGTNASEYIRENSDKRIPFKDVSLQNNQVGLLQQGTQIYVKGTAGTGTIAVSGYYL